jgi:hypothetical protein
MAAKFTSLASKTAVVFQHRCTTAFLVVSL